MTRDDRMKQAARIIDDSDGTVEDMAKVAAMQCRFTAEECEAHLVLALKSELEKILGGAV